MEIASSLENHRRRPERRRLSSWIRGSLNLVDYAACFTGVLARLQAEQRYRVFADLERIAGRFPHAIWHSPQRPKNIDGLIDTLAAALVDAWRRLQLLFKGRALAAAKQLTKRDQSGMPAATIETCPHGQPRRSVGGMNHSDALTLSWE